MMMAAPPCSRPSTSVNSHSGRVRSKPLMAASAAAPEHLVAAVRRRGVDPAQMPGDVEVGIGRPPRRGQVGGHLDRALPERGDLAGRPL